MKYFLFLFLSISVFLFVTCDSEGNSLYGNCKTGDRRCSGTKLEFCSDYKEWTLLADCSDSGGECIYEKGDYYCSEEVGETTDQIYEWEDEEEVEDDSGAQMLDNFGSPVDENDETADEDESKVATDEVSDDDSDYDSDDFDADDDTVDDDVIPVCGNGVLEGDEICEKNDVKDCTEIDPVTFTGGKAICDDTCMNYNTVTCIE